MNKLIFILFLSTYGFYGLSADIETDPIKAFDELKNKALSGADFDNELKKIVGLFDLTKDIDLRIYDLLDKMSAEEVRKFRTSIMLNICDLDKGEKYIDIILIYCKERLRSFLVDFAGFETFDFASPQLIELAWLINMSPKDKNSLFSKENINSILKAIVNLSYKDLAQNTCIFKLLKEVLKGLEEYPLQHGFRLLANQARFKLSYLVGYEDNLQRIVKSDLPKKYDFSWETPTFDVIYNNDGYSTIEHKTFIKGNPIEDTNNPIGYVIFMPKKEIKNIVVKMYGGWQKNDISTNLDQPRDYLSNEEANIVNNQTVLIELNLPDLLKNDSRQEQMNVRLLLQIHKAVDHFYNILKNNPAEIHENLAILKDIPIFLMGSSFGGMMSVFHAINFPGTFTGYISHAGGLFGQEGYDRMGYNDYLKVASINDIKYIENPVFIHHSLDDNRVNVKASLEFYRLAKLAKKEHLIKLFIDDHGSSVGDKEPGLHGHFFPERYYLKLFSQQLIDFINSNGKNIEPALNTWRYEKYTKIAHRLEGLGYYVHREQKRDLHKVLLSKGLTYYNDLRKSGNKNDFEKLWSTQVAPYLWKISFEESLRPENIYSTAKAGLAAFNMRQEFKKLLKYGKEMVKATLEGRYSRYSDKELIITDDFINNVLQDMKNWLNDKRKYSENGIISHVDISFVSTIISENVFNILLEKQAPIIVEFSNNTKLKVDIFNAIKEQQQRALKIIYDKITKDPKKVNSLIESYR